MTSSYNNMRVFRPVILFHDHSFSPISGVTQRIHIPIGDPYYAPLIQQKKLEVDMMLAANGCAWNEIIQRSRQQELASPKPTHRVDRRRPTQFILQQYGSNKNKNVSEGEDDEYFTTTSPEESDNHSFSNVSVVSPKPREATTTTNKKRRGNLPKAVTAVLKQWLTDHCKNPYPTEAEKADLKDKTDLTLNQISNWFINARRRLLPQILKDQQPIISGPTPTGKRKRNASSSSSSSSSSFPTTPDQEVSKPAARKRRKYTKRQ